MTQPVTPDLPSTPLPDSGDGSPVEDPAAVVDQIEQQVFEGDDPLDRPAPEIEQQQTDVEPPD